MNSAWARRAVVEAALACERAFDGPARSVLGVVQQRDRVEWRAEHEDLPLGLQHALKRRALAVSVTERVLAGDPLRQRAKSDHSGTWVVAPERSGPGAKSLVENTVVASCASDALVEDGDLRVTALAERLEVDIGDDGAGRLDGILQSLHDDGHTSGDRPHRPHAGVHHDHAAGRNAKLAEVCRER